MLDGLFGGDSMLPMILIGALLAGIFLKDPVTGDSLLSIVLRTVMAMFQKPEPVSARRFRARAIAVVDEAAATGNVTVAKAALDEAAAARVTSAETEAAFGVRAGGILNLLTGNMMPILLVVGALVFLPMITGGGGCGGGGGCKQQPQNVEQAIEAPETPAE